MLTGGTGRERTVALDAYLRLEGETQGTISGSATRRGREGAIVVYGWSHQVVSPRDAASGMATGRRQHHPFVITKPVDRATPLLRNLLTQNENIPQWRLECWQAVRSGKQVLVYTVELVNASVAEIRAEQLNNQYPENAKHEIREHVSFSYQKVIWTWQDGGIVAEDDWATLNV